MNTLFWFQKRRATRLEGPGHSTRRGRDAFERRQHGIIHVILGHDIPKSNISMIVEIHWSVPD